MTAQVVGSLHPHGTSLDGEFPHPSFHPDHRGHLESEPADGSSLFVSFKSLIHRENEQVDYFDAPSPRPNCDVQASSSVTLKTILVNNR